MFQELLRTQGIAPYPGSIRLLDHLAGLGIPAAVVSSSRNAREVLEAAGLADRFAVVADGVVAAERGIPGKPAPDLFLAAAEQLGVPPDKSVVVEDALSGVAAGRAGGFGLVVGVDRGAGREALAPTAPTSSSMTSPSSCRRREPTDETPRAQTPAAAPLSRSTRGGSSSGSTTCPTSG